MNEDAYYIFAVDAPGGSKIYLGDKMIINNSKKPKSGIQSYAIYLKQGYYTIKAQLLQIEDAKKPNFRLFRTTKFSDRWWENEMQL